VVNRGAGELTDPYEKPSTAGMYDPKTGKYKGVGVLGWDPVTGILGYSVWEPQKSASLDPKVQQALRDCIDANHDIESAGVA